MRRRNGREIIHQSQKPPEEADIDFEALGLKYPMTHTPEKIVKAHYWTPPPVPENTPDLPFMVDRTFPGKGLPVYVKYIGGGTKVVTEFRKVKGDIAELKNDIEKVVGKEVTLRPGKILIEGNFKRRLQKWLVGLGF